MPLVMTPSSPETLCHSTRYWPGKASRIGTLPLWRCARSITAGPFTTLEPPGPVIVNWSEANSWVQVTWMVPGVAENGPTRGGRGALILGVGGRCADADGQQCHRADAGWPWHENDVARGGLCWLRLHPRLRRGLLD